MFNLAAYQLNEAPSLAVKLKNSNIRTNMGNIIKTEAKVKGKNHRVDQRITTNGAPQGKKVSSLAVLSLIATLLTLFFSGLLNSEVRGFLGFEKEGVSVGESEN
ncbi:MAG: hypothetical protein F6J86_27175 [Symploca sp. SIO1B1]|nr:hypothetical protein [Symploca sp. SIO1B1]